MAKINAILGKMQGRIGNIVFATVQGVVTGRERPMTVLNPKTAKQEEQRMRFSLYATLAGRCNAWLSKVFKNLDGYERGNFLSAFVGYNFKHDKTAAEHQGGIDGTYPALVLNYPYIQFSPATGNLSDGADLAGSINEGTITISWEDESANVDNCNADDVCMALVICETKRQVLSNTTGAARSTRQLLIELPLDWEGETVQVYTVFRDKNWEKFSQTHFVGALSE